MGTPKGTLMKIQLALGAATIFFLPSLACDSSATDPVDPSTKYPVTFICASNGGSACPPGTECPALPLGADTCGDLPGLFGHPTTPATTGRSVGCTVGLSYGNPFYADSQQVCTCSTLAAVGSPPASQWECPI